MITNNGRRIDMDTCGPVHYRRNVETEDGNVVVVEVEYSRSGPRVLRVVRG